MKPTKPENCTLCNRELELSFHHLIPKKMHDKRQVVQQHADKDLDHYGIWICNDCHKKIHRLFSHHLLATEYYTVKALKSHEQFSRFLNWVRKQTKRVKR